MSRRASTRRSSSTFRPNQARLDPTDRRSTRNVTAVEGMECWRAKNPVDAITIPIRVWGVLVEPVKQGGSEPFAKANTAPTTVPSSPSTPNTAVAGTKSGHVPITRPAWSLQTFGRSRVAAIQKGPVGSCHLSGRQAQARKVQFAILRVPKRIRSRHNNGGEGHQPLDDRLRFGELAQMPVAGCQSAIGRRERRNLFERYT